MVGAAVLTLLAPLAGCSTLGYYGHLAHGEASLLVHRKPIDEVVADADTDAGLRKRLEEAQAARRFASDRLGLPRNKSYTSYVDLGRPYATWNVFATPEFSVDPLTHCFPFAGCVAYVGFFDKARAEREREDLARQGNDTAIEGSAAYSTLGWFSDPILSSMLRWNDDELDGVIFHELAHQRVYVADDTAFNESYASFVAEQGLREWRVANGRPTGTRDASHEDGFTRLVLDLRERLRVLYASSRDAAAKRAGKAAEIDAFRRRYVELRDREWNGGHGYDAWVAAPINNASLVPFGLYDRWVGAFAMLYAQGGGWDAFHARVRELARLDHDRRERRLAALEDAGAAHSR